MIDFSDHKSVLEALPKVQGVENDNRERVRDNDHFLNKKNGQWEPDVFKSFGGKPRYTFDQCNPVVDQIMGEIEQSEFSISVRPSGNGASKDTAKTYDGLIRNIESISNAKNIYNAAARRMVGTAISGWRVVHDWIDGDSFDQDLLIKPISNFVDRVWFDPNAELADMSDAEFCFVLNSMSKDAYDKEFPDGSGLSVGDDRHADVYCEKKEEVVVGEIIFKKKTSRDLVRMTNGAVYVDDDDFKKIKDELEQEGITEERRRKRETSTIFTRLFDGGDWLSGEQKTVFSTIPVVPLMANFEVSENKVIYWSAIEKLMDSARVYNYAKSRQIEEGALSPRPKVYMTREQAAKDLRTLQTQNTNADPIQTYTHVDGQPPPFPLGGPQVNISLQQTAIDAKADISSSSGLFGPSMGNVQGVQSGVAIELQQNKGDNSSYKYFKVTERGILRTCQIIIDAAPKVYDSKRQVRVLDQAGETDIITLNDVVFDEDSQKNVEINDLSKGTYDVTCKITEAFSSQRQKTVKAITEIAAIDPSIIQGGSDILLGNIDAPGIDLLAERKRMQMVTAGLIPQTQMTDEEKALVQQIQASQQQQQQQPDPVQQLAQANLADVISKASEREEKIMLAAEREINRAQESERKFELEVARLQQNQQKIDNDAQNDQTTAILQFQQALDQQLKTQAETLKLIREAQGIDTFTGPHGQEAFIDQAVRITETQDKQP